MKWQTGASVSCWICSGLILKGILIRAYLLLPEDWEGKHPLRKDFPLGYEEVQFTFNIDEIDLRKPYAKE